MTELSASENEQPAPWLTIVTAVKDDRAGLSATAASIADQDLDDVEWIVVDSSDPPVTRIDAPAPLARISRLVSTPPQGVYAAMNAGLHEARGAFIMFANAGDRLASPRVLEAFRSAIVAQGPDWLYGRLILEDSHGRRRLSGEFSYPQEKRRRFRRGRFPWHPASIVRTRVLRSSGGFDEAYPIAADYRMMLALSERSDPVALATPVSVFRLDGVSARRWRESLRQAYRARCEVFELHGWRAAAEWVRSVPVFARSAASRSLGRA